MNKRYKDDVYLSIAYATIANCLRYEKGVNHLKTYIKRSVYRACKAYVPRESLPLTFDPIAHTSIHHDITSFLPPDLKILVELKYYHNYTLQEIANLYDKSESWVRYKINEAFDFIRLNYNIHTRGMRR